MYLMTITSQNQLYIKRFTTVKHVIKEQIALRDTIAFVSLTHVYM